MTTQEEYEEAAREVKKWSQEAFLRQWERDDPEYAARLRRVLGWGHVDKIRKATFDPEMPGRR